MRKTSSRAARKKAARAPSGEFRFDPRALVRAAGEAVREALRDHKRAGNPVATVVDGRVVLIPPSRIKV